MKDPNNFTEVTFKGSVPQMIKQTMDYLRSNLLREYVHKVSGRQEADRFWNYPYDAIEEAVVNAVYHRDFTQYEPIEITIEPNAILILNCPGPDRSISSEEIERGEMLKSRRYRNRRLGDYLKELDLTEGRSTGIPTIQAKLAENGSPRAVFETTDDRLTFLITIPIHEHCDESLEIRSETSSGTTFKSSGTPSESSETGSGTALETVAKSSGTQHRTAIKILELIKNNSKITTPQIAMELGISTRGVEKNLRMLRESGLLKRVGSPTYGGHWEIVTADNEQP